MDHVEVADRVRSSIFVDGPYTSLKMLQYLLSLTQLSYAEYVKNPKALRATTEERIESDTSGGFDFTWASRTGRCTSFAVKVADALRKDHKGVFDFQIYNLSGHRLARCLQTVILIDSSSSQGAFELKENE